jgi:hypothetical protein
MRCQVCGIVPRQFWLFGGTKFWYHLFTDRWLCPSCYNWACRIIDRYGAEQKVVYI